MSNLQATLDEIGREQKQLRLRLAELAKQRQALFDAACPVAVGDVVLVKRGAPWLGIVREVRNGNRLGDKPWVMVSRKNKAGEWGRRLEHAFSDYELMASPLPHTDKR